MRGFVSAAGLIALAANLFSPISSEARAKLPKSQTSARKSGLASRAPPSRNNGTSKDAGLKWTGRCDPYLDLLSRANRSTFTTKAECDSLVVPADPDRPSGPELKLSLTRHRATDPTNRKGVLIRPQLFDDFHFAGRSSAAFPSIRLDQFDVIDFERTSSAVDGLLKCATDPHDLGLDPFAIDSSPEATMIYRAKVLASCKTAKDSAGLVMIDVRTLAGDLERVRLALHEEQVTILSSDRLGRVAIAYGAAHPSHVRAMLVLSPVLGPAQRDVVIEDARLRQGDVDAFLDACGTEKTCPLNGAPGPRARVDAVLALASAQTRLAFVKELLDASGDKRNWAVLAIQVRQLEMAAPTSTAPASTTLPPPSDAEQWSPYLAVFACFDGSKARDPTAVAEYADRLRAASWLSAILPPAEKPDECVGFPVVSTPLQEPAVLTAIPTVLTTDLKGSGMPTYAKRVGARLVTIDRSNHQNDACLEAALQAYLSNLTIPTERPTC